MAITFQRAVEEHIPAAHHSGERRLADITLLVIHDTEGDTAIGAASWFANPASQGSAHLSGDADHLYRSLHNKQIGWGVADVNSEALHYEMAGVRAWWDRRLWLTRKSRRIYHQAAYRMARWAVELDVPLNFRTVDELNKMGTLTGVTTHMNLSLSRHSSSTHTDPGRGFPRRRFMRALRFYARQLRQHQGEG